MQLKTYQIDGNKKRIDFTNYDRLDEEILTNMILGKIKQNNTITIGKCIMGPSENLYNCYINDMPFSLVCDLIYGAFIYSESNKAIDELLVYFNNSN